MRSGNRRPSPRPSPTRGTGSGESRAWVRAGEGAWRSRLLVHSSRACRMVESSDSFGVQNSHVDVLAAAGLVAVDGDRVLAGFEGGFGGGGDFEFFVAGDVAGRLGGEDAVDVDLGVLVVVHGEDGGGGGVLEVEV